MQSLHRRRNKKVKQANQLIQPKDSYLLGLESKVMFSDRSFKMLKFLIFLSFSLPAFATLAEETTITEDLHKAARNTKTGVKKGARAIQDKTCEMINGKIQCLGKKMKHKIENATDDIKDKSEQIK